MKYQVLQNFKVKTSKGELELQSGQIVTLPHEIIIELLNKGKIIPIEKAAYKIYSEILQAYLWVVETDQDMHSLKAQGITEAIYTFDECQKLKGLSKDSMKCIHNVKEIFENSKVNSVNKLSKKS